MTVLYENITEKAYMDLLKEEIYLVSKIERLRYDGRFRQLKQVIKEKKAITVRRMIAKAVLRQKLRSDSIPS